MKRPQLVRDGRQAGGAHKIHIPRTPRAHRARGINYIGRKHDPVRRHGDQWTAGRRLGKAIKPRRSPPKLLQFAKSHRHYIGPALCLA